jgi:hypothetical protein
LKKTGNPTATIAKAAQSRSGELAFAAVQKNGAMTGVIGIDNSVTGMAACLDSFRWRQTRQSAAMAA